MKNKKTRNRVMAAALCSVMAVLLSFSVTTRIWATPLDSKKGLQGDYMVTQEGVTGKHMLLNLYLDAIDSEVPTEKNYYVAGNNYYFEPSILSAYETRLKEAAAKDIDVTIVVLMRGNAHCAQMGMMAAGFGATDPNRLYALNPDSDAVEAFFGIIAHDLCNEEYGAKNWILGNEVNMPDAYNFTGTLDLETNVDIYTRTFLLFSQMLRVEGYSGYAKASISLDHSWTDDGNGAGIAGKDFLDLFAKKMKSMDPSCGWNIAYHLYAPDLSKTSSIWTDPELSADDENAKFISPLNLNVLTDYVKENFGDSHRIILSEQGYDISEGETVQAAALAMSYAAAVKNDMVDAVIYRSLVDEGTDAGLDLGLKNADGTPREAFQVYQEMDGSYGSQILNQYQAMIDYLIMVR